MLKWFIIKLSDSSGPSVICGETGKDPSWGDAASFRVIGWHQVLVPLMPLTEKAVFERRAGTSLATRFILHPHYVFFPHWSTHKML